MNNIYLHHENEQVGPFTEEKVRRYLDEGRIEPSTLGWVEGADWKPIGEMLGLAVAAAPQQAPPPPRAVGSAPQQQASAYVSPQVAARSPQSDPKKLILASWLMIGVTCLISLIPGVGFLTWVVAAPILLVTFIMGIITLNKGKTLQGVSILLVSLVAAPLFLVVAPIITTVGAVAAADSGGSSNYSSDSNNSDNSDNSDSYSSTTVNGDLKRNLVGYWKSVKKNDFDDTHLYQGFSETEYFDVAGWIPYKVTGTSGNKLTYAWSQDSGELGEFDRNTSIVFLSDDRMRIDFDRFSEGYVYERISEDKWLQEQQELQEEAIQELRQKIGATLQRLEGGSAGAGHAAVSIPDYGIPSGSEKNATQNPTVEENPEITPTITKTEEQPQAKEVVIERPEASTAMRIAELKGELAVVDAKIASETARWQGGIDTINRLTNFKRTPVREGSPQYHQCMEASRIIKEVESGAAALKAEKARLTAMIESLQK
jgi:hypothetical protein